MACFEGTALVMAKAHSGYNASVHMYTIEIVIGQCGQRVPGSARSGPARRGGWRTGTTPSGRPRGDAARASAKRKRAGRKAKPGTVCCHVA